MSQAVITMGRNTQIIHLSPNDKSISVSLEDLSASQLLSKSVISFGVKQKRDLEISDATDSDSPSQEAEEEYQISSEEGASSVHFQPPGLEKLSKY
ncbi:hypothetical protein HK096_010931 [Nowakowskiella sp. JEL0078]|nr:hypothetical protein HK096_010931 [Nowakowskiella sp. JEL0078]